MKGHPDAMTTTITMRTVRSLWIASVFGAQLCVAQSAPKVLSLEEALETARSHNHDLELARLGVEENKAKKQIAKSAYFPSIRNDSGVLHVTELAGIQIPAGAFGHSPATGLIPAESLFIGQGGSTSYTSGTGLAQPITQLFRINEANHAAAADVSSAQEQARDAENGILLKVRQSFFAILIAMASDEAAQLEIAANKVKNEEVLRGVADGRALEVSALESHASLLEAEHSELSLRLKIRDLTRSLNELLGFPLDTQLNLVDRPEGFAVDLPTREEALRKTLVESPRVREAELLLVKARAGYHAARDKYIPDITGIARYSYQSGVPLLVHNFGTFGFSMSFDVFDGGKRNAEVEEARVKMRQAEVNLEKTKREVEVQVDAAYNKLEDISSLLAVAEESFTTRKELARVTNEQFLRNATLASNRDEANAKLAQAKAALYEATLGQSLAQADVLRLIGQRP